MAANFSKSLCLLERRGYLSQCGRILVARAGTLVASNLMVLSDLSGRSDPHPRVRWNSSSTSARSPFWLTEKLGRISQPNLWRLLRLKLTQKHPSPSAYPDRYALAFESSSISAP